MKVTIQPDDKWDRTLCNETVTVIDSLSPSLIKRVVWNKARLLLKIDLQKYKNITTK